MILIVEDEPKLAKLLEDYLQAEKLESMVISDGDQVTEWVRMNNPDLILLDLMLPGKNGIDICREVRNFYDQPIIMLTAKAEEVDRILGLEIGADDYVCKPYSPREVVARVKAQLRRSNKNHLDAKETEELIKLDHDRFLVFINGNKLVMTPVEFRLLEKLSSHPSKVFSRQQLMTNVYDDHRVVTDRTIDSHIKNIRKKLALHLQQDLIHSVYGVGYKWEPEIN